MCVCMCVCVLRKRQLLLPVIAVEFSFPIHISILNVWHSGRNNHIRSHSAVLPIT